MPKRQNTAYAEPEQLDRIAFGAYFMGAIFPLVTLAVVVERYVLPDLGDPVYAVSDGLVIYAGWASDGWGNVVILLHELPNGHLVETFYGHLDSIHVPVGRRMRRGDMVGTIGTANGRYLAHLHFEIRRYPTLDVGAGYNETKLGRLSGELYIRKWRGREDDQLSAAPVGEPLPAKPLQVDQGPPTAP